MATLSAFCVLSWALALSCLPVLAIEHFNMTAIAANKDGVSVIECCQLASPFVTASGNSTDNFAAMQLGNLANATYSICPAGIYYGAHVGPAVQ